MAGELIEAAERAAAKVRYVEIDQARLHDHQHTDEIYYVIAGRGAMALDEEQIELHPVVYVPRGVKHKAAGKLTVLTVCIPRGVLDDPGTGRVKMGEGKTPKRQVRKS